MLHIFWDCPNIRLFWTQILEICTNKLQLDIPSDPAATLLHHNMDSIFSYKKYVTHVALNAAKILIPCKWKSDILPTLTEWIKEMEEIC
ncbi:hypothetical protein XELAEV_18045370mg [Xenopus laevis]|uniref:Uncharacterized protein n=1 Tax=Xenopus laevis TaxID=8355 RepID=A0A974C0H2_XENLA|nr:hypothetical protein XELAEV_18045370mg [Xenopus laevis]